MNYVYYPDAADWEQILVGRRVVGALDAEDHGVLTLDDGTTIRVRPNEGCGGCTNGLYYLSHIAAVDNIITAVRCEKVERHRDRYDEEAYVYTVFVIADNEEINLLTIEGDDGNGYYGSGYSIELLEG